MSRQTREARAILFHSHLIPEEPNRLAKNIYTRRNFKVGETQFVTLNSTYTLTSIEIAPNQFNGIDMILHFHDGKELLECNLTYSGSYTINWTYGENHE